MRNCHNFEDPAEPKIAEMARTLGLSQAHLDEGRVDPWRVRVEQNRGYLFVKIPAAIFFLGPDFLVTIRRERTGIELQDNWPPEQNFCAILEGIVSGYSGAVAALADRDSVSARQQHRELSRKMLATSQAIRQLLSTDSDILPRARHPWLRQLRDRLQISRSEAQLKLQSLTDQASLAILRLAARHDLLLWILTGLVGTVAILALLALVHFWPLR